MAVAMPDGSGHLELWTKEATDAIVEVVGYYSTPDGDSATVFEPVTPARLTDTRSGIGTCVPAPCDRLEAQETVQVQVAGQVGLPAQGVEAVTVNITADSPSGNGFLKVNRQDGGEGTAVMGFSAGQTTNLTTVGALDGNGRISIFSSKATDVVIDVVGYHTSPEGTSGTVFVPLEPARVAKTATARAHATRRRATAWVRVRPSPSRWRGWEGFPPTAQPRWWSRSRSRTPRARAGRR